MQINNKTILIISPNSWGVMHISKHHYAISLMKRGNVVYFLNPPDKKLTIPFKIEKHEVYNNLFIVSYRPYFPLSIRFHFNLLYAWLMKWQIIQLNKQLKTNFDIIWCFETNLYYNLKLFKGKTYIYHPVDQVRGGQQSKIEKSADYIFSVSQNILKNFTSTTSRKLQINHGLSWYFETKSIEILTKGIRNYKANTPFQIGYIGNLFIYSLDRKVFREIIEVNTNIEFHIWSPINISESNVSGDLSEQTKSFIEFLMKSRNVILHGVTTPEKLSEEIQKMDAFLICYDTKKDPNHGCNTHKLLEYLSTGKVVVCNFISDYADKKDLVQMVENNEQLVDCVKETVSNIDYYNNSQNQNDRIQFSLENTYSKQIKKIESFINSVTKE